MQPRLLVFINTRALLLTLQLTVVVFWSMESQLGVVVGKCAAVQVKHDGKDVCDLSKIGLFQQAVLDQCCLVIEQMNIENCVLLFGLFMMVVTTLFCLIVLNVTSLEWLEILFNGSKTKAFSPCI